MLCHSDQLELTLTNPLDHAAANTGQTQKLFLTKPWFSRRKDLLFELSGNNSVVECDLAKVEVAGSNPVSRSIFFGGIAKW